MKTTLSNALIDLLSAKGVSTFFGVPGDYIVQFCLEIEKRKNLKFVPLSTEAGAGFAAQAYARSGASLGVVCVTYGVGGLSMINQVACAYAEMTPLVVISGGPGRQPQEGLLLHHQVKSPRTQLKIYEEVTEYAAVLDNPETAYEEICRAIDVALETMRPVYLELPRDMVDQEILVPKEMTRFKISIDQGGLEEASQEMVEQIQKAERPVLVVGIEVHRRRLREQVVALAEKLGCPVASDFLARGTFPLNHSQYVGTYLGDASESGVQEIVEGSDCLILLGSLMADTNLSYHFLRMDPNKIIHALGHQMTIRHHKYENTSLPLLLEKLLTSPKIRSKKSKFKARQLPRFSLPELTDKPVTTRDIVQITNYFLQNEKQLILIADTGDSIFISYEIQADRVMAPAFYATMGFAIPSGLGVQIGRGERPIILLGDGSFQMTGLEISHCSRYGVNPIVILLNNERWGMLQSILPANYNNLIPWSYSEMARLWGGDGFLVKTPREFKEALWKVYASNRFSLIEVLLQPGDITETLQKYIGDLQKSRKVNSR
ncbi:MAG: indolepyruvate/phenylpyruvate decarboxylase [Deltaproteobacteria bacterium]|nr:indolepyruvate/phenylpyruvate decarboxylase [Deltaproteobacteria bacterium]